VRVPAAGGEQSGECRCQRGEGRPSCSMQSHGRCYSKYVKSGEVLGFARTRPLKLLLALGTLVLAAVVAVVIVVVHHGGNGFAWPAPVAVSSQPFGPFPAPPQGAVVFSRQLGSDALALGVVAVGDRLGVQASVLGGQGTGVSGLDVAFTGDGATVNAEECGAGCYRAVLPSGRHAASVTVAIRRGPSAVRWRVALPETWPPADASALVLRAGRVWRSLRSLSYHESLASSPSAAVQSAWRVVAPDRVAYTVVGEGGGVIIGARRWDQRTSNGPWVESPQTRLTQPLPAWSLIADAHVLGTTTVQGHPVWIVSFFDPGTPAWFEARIDRATMRTLETHMVTTAHFMRDTYGAFNTTPPIVPPK
jgi:hypothetical protein